MRQKEGAPPGPRLKEGLQEAALVGPPLPSFGRALGSWARGALCAQLQGPLGVPSPTQGVPSPTHPAFPHCHIPGPCGLTAGARWSTWAPHVPPYSVWPCGVSLGLLEKLLSRHFIFLGSKITTDSDCGHEIKRCLLLGRKAMAILDSILKSRDVTLPPKVHLVKAMVFQ